MDISSSFKVNWTGGGRVISIFTELLTHGNMINKTHSKRRWRAGNEIENVHVHEKLLLNFPRKELYLEHLSFSSCNSLCSVIVLACEWYFSRNCILLSPRMEWWVNGMDRQTSWQFAVIPAVTQSSPSLSIDSRLATFNLIRELSWIDRGKCSVTTTLHEWLINISHCLRVNPVCLLRYAAASIRAESIKHAEIPPLEASAIER